MRALKTATLLLMGVTLALFSAAAFSLRDGRGAPRRQLVAYVKRARTLSLMGVGTFLISSAGAAYLFSRAKREYRDESRRNLEGLIEGARDDLRKKSG